MLFFSFVVVALFILFGSFKSKCGGLFARCAKMYCYGWHNKKLEWPIARQGRIDRTSGATKEEEKESRCARNARKTLKRSGIQYRVEVTKQHGKM